MPFQLGLIHTVTCSIGMFTLHCKTILSKYVCALPFRMTCSMVLRVRWRLRIRFRFLQKRTRCRLRVRWRLVYILDFSYIYGFDLVYDSGLVDIYVFVFGLFYAFGFVYIYDADSVYVIVFNFVCVLYFVGAHFSSSISLLRVWSLFPFTYSCSISFT